MKWYPLVGGGVLLLLTRTCVRMSCVDSDEASQTTRVAENHFGTVDEEATQVRRIAVRIAAAVQLLARRGHVYKTIECDGGKSVAGNNGGAEQTFATVFAPR